MSDASTFPDSRRLRVTRTLGLVGLLVLQGGCGIVLAGVLRNQRDTAAARPTRAANRAALERMGTAAALESLYGGGTIDWFDNETIVVTSYTGERIRVRVDPETVYLRQDGAARASDLYPGANVVVSGSPDPDGAVLADVILVAKP
jgi:hypothetical protein